MNSQIKILLGLLAIGAFALLLTVFSNDPGGLGSDPDQPDVE